MGGVAGPATVRVVQLRGVPFARRRRDGAPADGRQMDLRQPAGEHFSDHPRGPPERHAVVPRQAERTAGLAARRLRPFDERPAAQGRLAQPRTQHECEDARAIATETDAHVTTGYASAMKNTGGGRQYFGVRREAPLSYAPPAAPCG